MSLKGKNKCFFSYTNADCKGKKFIYKDFEKTHSYHSNFSETLFEGTSFRAASLKFCSFYSAVFKKCDFIGTIIKGCNFTNVSFEGCIFSLAKNEKNKFNNTTFSKCILVGASNDFLLNSPGIEVLPQNPLPDIFSSELLNIVEALRSNSFIRQSRILHCKREKINTFSLYILLKDYSETELIKYLPLLPSMITSNFYTLSYIVMLLEKIKKADILNDAPPLSLGNPELNTHGSTD